MFMLYQRMCHVNVYSVPTYFAYEVSRELFLGVHCGYIPMYSD